MQIQDSETQDQEDLSLMDFLSDEYIIQIDRAEGWREVMQMASGPLISHGNAEERYVKRVLAQYHDNSVHIIFGEELQCPTRCRIKTQREWDFHLYL